MDATFYHGLEDYHSDEKNVYTINNNDYGKPGVQHLREIVGLTGDFEYDATAIEDVQQARYAKMSVDQWKDVTKDKDAEAPKKKGQIIWLHGYPCSGKTFTGDYLATVGWHNEDGDWFSRATDPNDLLMAKNLF